MSGREHEPVAAFFPSIDRNLIRDLDRHLRGGKPAIEPAFAPDTVADLPPHQPAPLPPALARGSSRPNIANVVEAVEQAAHSISAMTSRIEELEGHIDALEANNRQLETSLAEADQAARGLEEKLSAETVRANRLDAVSSEQAARVADLERDLATVHSDLARVTEAISAALGLPEE